MQRTGNGISPAVLRAVQKERRKGSFHVNIYAFIVPHVAQGSGETRGTASSANSTNPLRDPSAELCSTVVAPLKSCEGSLRAGSLPWLTQAAQGAEGAHCCLVPSPCLFLSCWWLMVSSRSPAVSYLLHYPILSQLGGVEGDPLQIRPFEAGGGE